MFSSIVSFFLTFNYLIYWIEFLACGIGNSLGEFLIMDVHSLLRYSVLSVSPHAQVCGHPECLPTVITYL